VGETGDIPTVCQALHCSESLSAMGTTEDVPTVHQAFDGSKSLPSTVATADAPTVRQAFDDKLESAGPRRHHKFDVPVLVRQPERAVIQGRIDENVIHDDVRMDGDW